jgi:RNA polymerase sigma-70 factor (ECF subfamily)
LAGRCQTLNKDEGIFRPFATKKVRFTMHSSVTVLPNTFGRSDVAPESAPIPMNPWSGRVAIDPALAEIERLGERCKDGDASAWTALFPAVWPVLVRFVNRLYHSLDEQDAEDVAQTSLEAAIKGIHTYSGEGLFRAWLFGIASQQARALFRRKSAFKRGPTLLVPISQSTDRTDETAKSPSEATAESDRATILHRALEQLPEEDRDLIHLHFFGELTFKEIGQVRKMNPKTVYTRVSRCKAKLLDLLIRSNLTTADG